MTKLYKLLFPVFALICLFAPHSARATHVMGSDITWKCLGGDTFEVTVTAYRDCNGIPLSGTDLGYATDEGCLSGRIPAGASKCCGKDITPVCKKSCTRCTDLSCDFAFGIEQWTITAKIVLAAPCCKYTFSWQECCRNGAISTGISGNFYSEVSCDRCIKNPCDNSPYFTNPPVGIFCVNQCVVFNPGANDDDRDVNGDADSLAYAFGDPLGGPGSTLSYSTPYTPQTPLIYTGTDPDATFTPPLCAGFHLDPQTGDIEFRATKTDVTVMVQVIDEYRKDSLGIERKIGTIRRDLQISIIDCPDNHAPVITGINGGTQNSIKICAETQTCFNIKAFDIDPKDSVTMSWNNQIAGATFNIVDKSKKWPTGVFCWRPKKSDVRSYPYRFVITALDNACPIPGRASRSFSVYVIASPDATHFTKIQKCGLVYFQADVASSSTTSISDYVWTGDGAPGYGPLFIHAKSGTYQYTRAGTYKYTLNVTGPNGCVQAYQDSVKIPPFVYVSLPKDSTICENSSPLTVSATYGLGNKPYSFSWDHSSNTTTTLTQKITRDTVFVIHIKDGNGCTNYDSMKVHMQKLPKPNLGPDQRGCWGHDLMITTGLKHMKDVAWTHIKGKDTSLNYIHGDTLFVSDSGIYAARVQDSFGCPGSDTVNIFYNPLVKARNADTDVCTHDTVVLNAGVAGSDATFKWYNESHLNILLGTGRTYTIANSINTIKNGVPYLVVITQTRNGVTCIDSGRFKVRTHDKPKPILKPIPDKCVDDNAFSLTSYVDTKHTGGYWFYPPKPAAIVSDYLYPSIMGSTTIDTTKGWVHYRYSDPYRCNSDDSERVKITLLPQVTAGHDTEICTVRGRYILTNAYVSPSGGQWTATGITPKAAIVYSAFRDTVFFDPSAVAFDSVYPVIYKYTSKTGLAVCNNSDTVYIRVKTNPTIVISKVDSLCDTQDSVQLSATPSNGVWNIMDANTNPKALTFDAASGSYYFNPAVSGSGNHKLLYTAWGDPQRKLCPSSDSTNIFVIPAPPTSFKTEDDKYQYCVNHGPVKLVPNVNYPGSQFFGNTIGLVYQANGVYYFNPAIADTTDPTKNIVSFKVPYDGGNCFKTISKTIEVDGRPNVVIKTNGDQCDGLTSITLTAEADNVTDWAWTSPGGNTIPKGTKVGNTITTTYIPTNSQIKVLTFNILLDGWNAGLCAHSIKPLTVNINPSPSPLFTADSVGCEPFKTTFHPDNLPLPQGSLIATYEWDFGDGTKSTEKAPTHIYTVTNDSTQQHFTVSLKMTTGKKCEGTITKTSFITVNATPRPKILANPQFTTIAVPKIQFDVDPTLSHAVNFKDPNIAYFWSFGDNSNVTSTIRNPEHTYTDTGKFKVFLSVKSNECQGRDSVIIDIKPELIIFVPNVFKPDNHHGLKKDPKSPNYFSADENNTFQSVISSYATFEMNVYNRWGELMFNTTDPKKGWDGWYKGQAPVMDAYVYVIKATSYSGKPYTFTGTVTLLQ